MNRFINSGLIFILYCLFISFNSNAQNKITSYRYWFDDDHSSFTLTMVPPAEHLELNSLISLENLSNGLHIFNICFKDENGLWSVPTSQFFYYNNLKNNKITSYQYWFDNDYTTNKIVSATPAEHLNLVGMLPLDNITGGLHTISIRFKDIKGKWSVPVNQYFYKANRILQNNKIIAYRYWLNEDIENARYFSLIDPTPLLNLNEDLDFSDLQTGEYVIHFQFKDASDKWSLVTSDTFTHISTVGIENIVKRTIKVYPNPSTGLIRILSDQEFPLECTIEVHDYSGRLVLSRYLGNANNQELDLSQLSKGIYFLRIKNNNSYSNHKIVLQ